jgi:CheY-like chemotaxis protein
VPYTLLLADDSVTIQRVIELTFADEDVTVVAVSDGDQAIERLEASPVDIVLADIGMPGKNGYEVAQYIRRSPKLSHIPVVLLTGAFEPVDQARANEAGCDGVLAKPFEPQLVIGRVKELLARAHRGPAAPGPQPAAAAEGESPAPPPAAPVPDSIWAPPLVEQRPAAPFVDSPIAEAPAGPVPRGELNDYFDRLDAAFSTLSSGAPAQAAAPVQAIPNPPPAAIESDIDWFGAKEPETGSSEPWDLPAQGAETPPPDLPLSYASPQPEAPFVPPLPPPDTFAAVTTVEPIESAAPVVEAVPFAAPDERLAPIEESAPIEPAPVAAVPASVPAAPPPTPAPAPAVAPAPALELPLPNPPPLPALADAFAALLAAEQGEASSSAAALWPASQPAAAVVSDAQIDDIVRRVLARLSDTAVRDAVTDVASKVAERLVREEIERIKASIK